MPARSPRNVHLGFARSGLTSCWTELAATRRRRDPRPEAPVLGHRIVPRRGQPVRAAEARPALCARTDTHNSRPAPATPRFAQGRRCSSPKQPTPSAPRCDHLSHPHSPQLPACGRGQVRARHQAACPVGGPDTRTKALGEFPRGSSGCVHGGSLPFRTAGPALPRAGSVRREGPRPPSRTGAVRVVWPN